MRVAIGSRGVREHIALVDRRFDGWMNRRTNGEEKCGKVWERGIAMHRAARRAHTCTHVVVRLLFRLG